MVVTTLHKVVWLSQDCLQLVLEICTRPKTFPLVSAHKVEIPHIHVCTCIHVYHYHIKYARYTTIYCANDIIVQAIIKYCERYDNKMPRLYDNIDILPSSSRTLVIQTAWCTRHPQAFG